MMLGRRRANIGLRMVTVIAMVGLWLQDAAAEARARHLAADVMGFVNVRDFGAVGDGKTDDTVAIQAAIDSLPAFTRRNPFSVKPIFFPNGVYLVSRTLKRIGGDGRFEPGLALVGESEAGVTLRLKDDAPGFNDPGKDEAVLFFASGLMGGSSTAGGKDYVGTGEGNDAYQNYVQSMTINTGHGNHGAVGIDFLANNIGAIRNVRVIAPSSGKTGIALTRKWIGPALLKNVSVEGFDIGIDVANTEYSVVLDSVRVSGSRRYGIRNASNSVSFSNLRVATAGGIGIANLTPQALFVGRQARFEGSLAQPILNQGYMNLIDVAGPPLTTGEGVDRPAAAKNQLDGVYSPSGKIGDPAWQLPVKEPPAPPNIPWTTGRMSLNLVPWGTPITIRPLQFRPR